MRNLALVAMALSTGCAAHTLAHMEPMRVDGQEVLYRDGTPIVSSHGTRADVALGPKAGPTGRYRVEPRIYLLAAIRNLTDHRIEISEANFAVRGNDASARVVRAVEIEDEINSSAAWGQAVNAFATAANAMAAAGAGTTHVVGSAGGTPFHATSHNPGAAAQARRDVAREARANAAAIRETQEAQLRQLAYVIQRNTVDPGESVAGVLAVELPRASACKVMTSPGRPAEPATAYANARPGKPPTYGPGPCRIVVTVDVAGEAHTVTFDESFN